MLIDTLVDFCDKKYTTYGDRCGNGKCSHPSGKCCGSCYDCLYQIHFPERFKGQIIKDVYDCPKMLYHYVCQYSYLYASEILFALKNEHAYLSDYPYFHIMSIGCGACPDLMAFEKFYTDNNMSQPLSYMGIDVNSNWNPMHRKIEKYCDEVSIKRKLICDDAFAFFKKHRIHETNVIIISYMISYLYNNKQITTIDSFLESFTSNIVLKKKKNEKLLLIINDLNTYKKGRNYFGDFRKKIEKYNLSILNCTYKYFDTGDLYDGQKIGEPYRDFKCQFLVPDYIKTKYNARTKGQKTIQLILEVK